MTPPIVAVVVGDSGVGKTTLIDALVHERFSPQVEDVYPRVTFPAAEGGKDLVVVDTPSSEDRVAELEEAVRSARVILLVYSQDSQESYDRLSSHWFPLFAKLGAEHTPVILAANKMDTRGPDPMTSEECDPLFQPLMRDHAQLETSLECSAKEFKNVRDIFWFAAKAVEYPVAPVFNMNTRSLTDRCTAALTRIFHLCDFDDDGLLDDEELNGFQAKCFNSKLSPEELVSVKDVVRTAAPDGIVTLNDRQVVTGPTDEPTALTLSGFLYLHRLFIEKSRQQTTWIVLRTFCYNDDLLLDPDHVVGNALDKTAGDQGWEMTAAARSFLIALFKKADEDADGLLSPTELDGFWKAAPSNPWPTDFTASVSTSSTKNGAVTLEGFLAYWNLFYLRDARSALLHLKYLGYKDDTASAVCVTHSRQSDFIKERTSRNVFQVFVLGAPGSGKTSFVRSLVDKPFVEGYSPELPFSTVQEMPSDEDDPRSPTRYLILTEFAESEVRPLLADEAKMSPCDLIVLTYAGNDPNSFRYVGDLAASLPTNIPVVVVETKGDETAVPQNFSSQPETWCAEHDLPNPLQVSARTGRTLVYRDLLAVIMAPSVACPELERKLRAQAAEARTATFGVAGLVLGAAAVATAYFVYQRVKN